VIASIRREGKARAEANWQLCFGFGRADFLGISNRRFFTNFTPPLTGAYRSGRPVRSLCNSGAA
jgi:hypothetical protein